MYKIGDRVVITDTDLQEVDRVGYTYPLIDTKGTIIRVDHIANGHYTDITFVVVNDNYKFIGRFFEEALKIDISFYRNEKLSEILD